MTAFLWRMERPAIGPALLFTYLGIMLGLACAGHVVQALTIASLILPLTIRLSVRLGQDGRGDEAAHGAHQDASRTIGRLWGRR